MKIPGYIALTILILQSAVYAQSTIDVHRYNKPEGLPNSYVLNIAQDHKGFLWVATAGGLSRFDGQNFVNFGIRQGLNNLYVNNIFEDKNHRLWVSSLHEIYEMSNGQLISFGLEKANGSLYFYSFHQFKNGELWAFADKGQFVFENGKWLKRPFLKEWPGIVIRQAVETPEAEYLIGNAGLFLRRLNGDWKMHWVAPPDTEKRGPFFIQILEWNRKALVATKRGLYVYDEKGRGHHLFSAEAKGNQQGLTFVDSKNQIWFYPSGGRILYMAKKGQLEKFTDSLALKVSLFSAAFEDEGHHVWLATGEGLLQALPYKPDSYGKEKFPLIEEVRRLAAIGGNRVLAFSQLNGPILMEGMKPVRFSMENIRLLDNDFPDQSFTDSDGFIWLATRRGQLLRVKKSIPYRIEKIGMALHIAYDKQHRQVLVGNDTSFTIIDQKSARPVRHFSGIGAAYISVLNNGPTLLRTFQGKGFILGKENQLLPTKGWPVAGEGFGQARFFRDSDSTFWVYYFGGGLRYYGVQKDTLPKLLTKLSSDDGLPSDEVMMMEKDKLGRIWVITARGVAILIKHHVTGTWKVNLLNDVVSTNLPQTEFADIISDSAGNIWISQLENVVKINPGLVSFKEQTPRIVIEEVRVLQEDSLGMPLFIEALNAVKSKNRKIIFTHNQNTFQVKFTAIGLGSSLPRQYSYHTGLKGAEWSNPSSNSDVILSELVPGNYTFKVRVRVANSNWSNPAAFSFSIQPPFWETWWFRLLSICIAAAFIIFIFRQRIISLKEKADTRAQLLELEMTALKAQMNPHFIYNALNSIQALVGTNRNAEAIEYIGRFARLLRQVLEQSDNHVITLEKEIQTLQHYISLESLRMNIKPIVIIEMVEGLDPSIINLPPLILQPFVENSLWHGLVQKEGEKVLKLKFEKSPEGWLVCIIEDNGIGRAAASQMSLNRKTHESKGIDICTRRILDYNETVQPYPVQYTDLYNDDKTPVGTRVTLLMRL